MRNHAEEIGPSVVGQLREAHRYYSEDGRVLALVLITTATKCSSSLEREARMLEKELHVPVGIVLRDQLVTLLAQGLRRASLGG